MSQCGNLIIGIAIQRLENQRMTLDLRSQLVGGHPRDTEDWMCITSYNLDELIAAGTDGAPAVSRFALRGI